MPKTRTVGVHYWTVAYISMYGLPFLDASEVGDAFAFDIMPEADPDDGITLFANYMVDTFIDDNAGFPHT